jgi:hypothetical protein
LLLLQLIQLPLLATGQPAGLGALFEAIEPLLGAKLSARQARLWDASGLSWLLLGFQLLRVLLAELLLACLLLLQLIQLPLLATGQPADLGALFEAIEPLLGAKLSARQARLWGASGCKRGRPVSGIGRRPDGGPFAPRFDMRRGDRRGDMRCRWGNMRCRRGDTRWRGCQVRLRRSKMRLRRSKMRGRYRRRRSRHGSRRRYYWSFLLLRIYDSGQ